jgi:hypothetical protein
MVAGCKTVHMCAPCNSFQLLALPVSGGAVCHVCCATYMLRCNPSRPKWWRYHTAKRGRRGNARTQRTPGVLAASKGPWT